VNGHAKGQMKHANPSDRAISAQIEDLFFKAMELETEDERDAFLEQTCLGNETLREEVEWMIKSRAAEDFFVAQSDICIPARNFIDIISDHLTAIHNPKAELSADSNT